MERLVGVIIKIALVLGGMGLIKPGIIYFARAAIEAQAHSIRYGAFSRALNGIEAQSSRRTKTAKTKKHYSGG